MILSALTSLRMPVFIKVRASEKAGNRKQKAHAQRAKAAQGWVKESEVECHTPKVDRFFLVKWKCNTLVALGEKITESLLMGS